MCCCCTLRQTGLHHLATVKLRLPSSSGPHCSCLQPSLVLLPRLANQRFSHLSPALGSLAALRLVLLLAITASDLILCPPCLDDLLPLFLCLPWYLA